MSNKGKDRANGQPCRILGHFAPNKDFVPTKDGARTDRKDERVWKSGIRNDTGAATNTAMRGSPQNKYIIANFSSLFSETCSCQPLR
jgi:hypothetical protein